MARRALFTVLVNGSDITGALLPVVMSIQVSDKAGTASDTATIEVDDREGSIIMPSAGASMSIMLGFSDVGVSPVFEGTVDEVRARGDRGGGRTLSISAKGADSSGRAKERQQRHFDDKNIAEIMREAGKAAEITEVRVDPAFASIVRRYERMDDESFIAFGERLAHELGGTFKVSGNRAILAKRNGGSTPTGVALPAISAAWGVNLLSYDVAPFLGRDRYSETRTRYYDSENARWREVRTQTNLPGAQGVNTSRYPSSSETEAGEQSRSDAATSERESGEGSVTIDGEIRAQPEGLLLLSGTRPGIDGSYRIDEVSHDYNRQGGFTTTLTLRQPSGDAGTDRRGDAP